jgi:hypothetical protein
MNRHSDVGSEWGIEEGDYRKVRQKGDEDRMGTGKEDRIGG